MCKAVEWYIKVMDWIDQHPTTACMAAGFLVAWWMSGKFDVWNDKLLIIMHEQTAVQVETGRAIGVMSARLDALERKLERNGHD